MCSQSDDLRGFEQCDKFSKRKVAVNIVGQLPVYCWYCSFARTKTSISHIYHFNAQFLWFQYIWLNY